MNCRRRRYWAVCLAALVLAFSVNTLNWPRAVAASMSGVGTLEGTGTLPFFPCANCLGGTFSGRMAVSLSGLGSTTVEGVPVPYTAVWPASLASLPNLSASFGYDEACVATQPDNTPPLIGTAGGSFTLSGGTLILATGTIAGATLSGTFRWTRIGTAGHITMTDLVVTAGPTTTVSLAGSIEGQGAASVVLAPPWGTCAAQATSQVVTVAGIALQAV